MNINIDELQVGDIVPVPPKPRSEQEIMANWKGETCIPMVSMICQTFNHIDFIRDALNSLLMQETDFPFEIILHDDASTDGTTEVVKEYAKAYPNIIVPIIQTENQWSKGKRPSEFTHKSAKGNYICLCEGDDYWLDKKKISKQFACLQSKKNIVISYHDALVIDKDGKLKSIIEPNKDGYSEKELKKAPFIPTLTRFFRNNRITWIENPPLPISMDVVMTSYLSRYGGAAFSDSVLPSVYRHHDAGVWSLKSNAEKTNLTVNAMFFIASQYEMELDSEGKRFFLEKALSGSLANQSLYDALYVNSKLSIHILSRIKKSIYSVIKSLKSN
jgi:glycosyltransferase involved in cell wall biosynthesis